MKKLQELGKGLSKEEQKKIKGGDENLGGCCWHNAGWQIYECGLTQSEAQTTASNYAQTSGQHGYWCCASC